MKQIITALFALTLTACGFQPMYAPQYAGDGDIVVEPIEGREGHELRQALMRRLAPGLPGVDKGAVLTIDLDQSILRLAFQPDQAASRTDVKAEARYVLATGDGAISGTIRAETSYNVPDAPFADLAAQTDATERVSNLLSRRIVDDMRIKLGRQIASDGS